LRLTSVEVDCDIYLSVLSRVGEGFMASLECCAWRLEAFAFTTDPEVWATTYVDERMLG
jgi:predicted nuclease of predicted toxin-antitoxin system